MLQKLIELWPGGPTIPLGDYLVDFRYLFSFLIFVLALGALRWPGRAWLLTGTLLVASLAMGALELPLARPYGVVEGSRVLEDVGHVMVRAAAGSGSDGRLVDQPSPHPLWGTALAWLSGFDVERLWRWYPWLPCLALLCLGTAVAWSLGGLQERDELPEGTLAGLGAFFVLFLSAHRLSFLAGSTFWEAAFWRAPHVGVTLAVLCLCLRLLSVERPRYRVVAAALLVLAGWLEPRASSVFAAGALVWALGARSRGAFLSICGAIFLYLPFRVGEAPVELPADFGRSYDVLDRVFSMTVDSGLVFVLALAGIAMLWRSGRAAERLLAVAAASGLVAWGFVSSTALAARRLDPDVIAPFVRLWLAMAASYGFYRGLAAAGAIHSRVPGGFRFVPEILRDLSTARLGLAAFLALSLPWCFPYWWMPVYMDPTYVRSLTPITGNLFAMSKAIRESSEPSAVFVAGKSYAPWIPALSGRRVLLAEAEPLDLVSRRAAEQAFAFSNDASAIRAAADRYRLTHLAWGRLDQPMPDLAYLETSPLFEERYRLRRWVWIFEYRTTNE